MFDFLKRPAAANLGLFLGRAPLGAFFAVAGYMKISGHEGVTGFVHHASGTIPSFLPAAVGTVYLYLLPFLELAVGTMLALGLFTRVGGFVASLMLTSFMIAVTGVTSKDMPFQPNVIYLGIALLALLAGGGDVSLDRAAFGHSAGPR